MKKLLLVLSMLCLIVPMSITTTAYAQEEQTEVVMTEEEMQIQKVTGYIVSAVLGMLGTSGFAIIYKKYLSKAWDKVVDATTSLKAHKDKAEEDIENIKNEAQDLIASLKTLKEDIVTMLDNMLTKVKEEGVVQREAILTLANGFKELVVNGTSETINDLLKVEGTETNEKV